MKLKDILQLNLLFLISFSPVAQNLTIQNTTEKPITIQVEVMGGYKSLQSFDSLTIAAKGTAMINRKKSPLTFYRVTANKVIETFKDFVCFPC